MGVIGNVGFLGLPMLAVLMGEAAVAPLFWSWRLICSFLAR